MFVCVFVYVCIGVGLGCVCVCVCVCRCWDKGEYLCLYAGIGMCLCV